MRKNYRITEIAPAHVFDELSSNISLDRSTAQVRREIRDSLKKYSNQPFYVDLVMKTRSLIGVKSLCEYIGGRGYETRE